MNRSRLFALSVVHGLVHGTMNIFPVVLEPVRHQFGWSVAEIAWIGTIGYILFGVMALPAGWIADRIHRNHLLIVMLVGMATTLGVLTVWTTPLGFGVCWSLVGFFAGLYHPIGLSSVVTAGQGETGRAMGWHGLGGNFGFALMPLIAGVLATMWNWPVAFLMAGGLSVLMCPFFLISEENPSIDRSAKESSLNWSTYLVMILLLYGGVGFIYRGMITFVPSSFYTRWSMELELGAVGGLTTLVFLVGGLGQLGGGWLEENFGSLRGLLGLVVGYSLLTVGLLFTSGIAFLFLLMAWAALFFAGQPILNSMVSRAGESAVHGRLYGLAFAMNLGLGASGAGVTGQAIEWGGLNAGYMVVLVAIIFILILLGLLGKTSHDSSYRDTG